MKRLASLVFVLLAVCASRSRKSSAPSGNAPNPDSRSKFGVETLRPSHRRVLAQVAERLPNQRQRVSNKRPESWCRLPRRACREWFGWASRDDFSSIHRAARRGRST